MVDIEERHGLVSVLTGGVKDMPRNASWLLGKALQLGESPSTNGDRDGSGSGADDRHGSNTLVDAFRTATASVRDALPGGDSVEARLERARVAADRARDAEKEALEAARTASELSEQAERTEEQEQARLSELEADQADAVRRRAEDARARADEQVAKEQHEAELDANAVLARERAAAEKRTTGAREAAQAAQQDAEERLRRATEQLAEARSLADEAANAATEAANAAREQAERIAADAHRDAESASEAVGRAEKMQKRSFQAAAQVARAVDDKGTPGSLKELSKDELTKLAASQGISGRSGMSKSELVRALDKSKKAANG